MSLYENVFIHPLIEKKYENIKLFKHKNKDTFNICFHGHYPHLFKFEPFLKESIEYFDKNIKFLGFPLFHFTWYFLMFLSKICLLLLLYQYNIVISSVS